MGKNIAKKQTKKSNNEPPKAIRKSIVQLLENMLFCSFVLIRWVCTRLDVRCIACPSLCLYPWYAFQLSSTYRQLSWPFLNRFMAYLFRTSQCFYYVTYLAVWRLKVWAIHCQLLRIVIGYWPILLWHSSFKVWLDQKILRMVRKHLLVDFHAAVIHDLACAEQ